MNTTSSLSIGQLAQRADVPIDTIRYYEKAGLLREPARRESGYRQYGVETVKRLRFIRRAKELGFTLAEIAELLYLSEQGQRDMQGMKAAAQAKLGVVEAKLRELHRMRRGLRQLVEACPGHGALDDCPILNALSRDLS